MVDLLDSDYFVPLKLMVTELESSKNHVNLNFFRVNEETHNNTEDLIALSQVDRFISQQVGYFDSNLFRMGTQINIAM